MEDIASRGVSACNLKRRRALGFDQRHLGNFGIPLNNHTQTEFSACSALESAHKNPWPMLIMELCHVARLGSNQGHFHLRSLAGMDTAWG